MMDQIITDFMIKGKKKRINVIHVVSKIISRIKGKSMLLFAHFLLPLYLLFDRDRPQIQLLIQGAKS